MSALNNEVTMRYSLNGTDLTLPLGWTAQFYSPVAESDAVLPTTDLPTSPEDLAILIDNPARLVRLQLIVRALAEGFFQRAACLVPEIDFDSGQWIQEVNTTRLFSHTYRLQTRFLLFSQGLQYLAKINQCLDSPKIESALKQIVVRELLHKLSLENCPPGHFEALQTATEKLLSGHSLAQLLQTARRELLQQQVLQLINASGHRVRVAVETHYVSAVVNAVAAALGVMPTQDSYVLGDEGELLDSNLVKQLLEQLLPQIATTLSLERVLEYLLKHSQIAAVNSEESAYKHVKNLVKIYGLDDSDLNVFAENLIEENESGEKSQSWRARYYIADVIIERLVQLGYIESLDSVMNSPNLFWQGHGRAASLLTRRIYLLLDNGEIGAKPIMIWIIEKCLRQPTAAHTVRYLNMTIENHIEIMHILRYAHQHQQLGIDYPYDNAIKALLTMPFAMFRQWLSMPKSELQALMQFAFDRLNDDTIKTLSQDQPEFWRLLIKYYDEERLTALALQKVNQNSLPKWTIFAVIQTRQELLQRWCQLSILTQEAINQCDDGLTPLIFAYQMRAIECFRVLLQKGAALSVRIDNLTILHHQNILQLAANDGAFAFVYALVQKPLADFALSDQEWLRVWSALIKHLANKAKDKAKDGYLESSVQSLMEKWSSSTLPQELCWALCAFPFADKWLELYLQKMDASLVVESRRLLPDSITFRLAGEYTIASALPMSALLYFEKNEMLINLLIKHPGLWQQFDGYGNNIIRVALCLFRYDCVIAMFSAENLVIPKEILFERRDPHRALIRTLVEDHHEQFLVLYDRIVTRFFNWSSPESRQQFQQLLTSPEFEFPAKLLLMMIRDQGSLIQADPLIRNAFADRLAAAVRQYAKDNLKSEYEEVLRFYLRCKVKQFSENSVTVLAPEVISEDSPWPLMHNIMQDELADYPDQYTRVFDIRYFSRFINVLRHSAYNKDSPIRIAIDARRWGIVKTIIEMMKSYFLSGYFDANEHRNFYSAVREIMLLELEELDYCANAASALQALYRDYHSVNADLIVSDVLQSIKRPGYSLLLLRYEVEALLPFLSISALFQVFDTELKMALLLSRSNVLALIMNHLLADQLPLREWLDRLQEINSRLSVFAIQLKNMNICLQKNQRLLHFVCQELENYLNRLSQRSGLSLEGVEQLRYFQGTADWRGVAAHVDKVLSSRSRVLRSMSLLTNDRSVVCDEEPKVKRYCSR